MERRDQPGNADLGSDSQLTAPDLHSDTVAAANFLGLPHDYCGPDSSVWLLPVPYEATTTYGKGTRNGPAAVITASGQVELYDALVDREPALDYGVRCLAALELDELSPDAAVAQISEAVRVLSSSDRLLCVLGGEHGASIGVARGLREVYGEFVTVQIDAHADLRDSYEGSDLNHACTARRILELGGSVVQVGVRSLDITEAIFLRESPHLIKTFFARDIRQSRDYLIELGNLLQDKTVYLTIDVDGLDPSVIPATGTPEPGGLGWYDVIDVITTVASASHVIAFDCVELAPIAGQHASDFATAKLVYQTMTLIMSSPSWARLPGKT